MPINDLQQLFLEAEPIAINNSEEESEIMVETVIERTGGFLFGSRSKGAAVAGSDYDIAIPYSLENRILLIDMGFCVSFLDEKYCDDYTCDLLLHPEYPEIQVLTKLNFDKFRRAWEGMPEEIFDFHVSKRSEKYAGLPPDQIKLKIMEFINDYVKRYEDHAYDDREVI